MNLLLLRHLLLLGCLLAPLGAEDYSRHCKGPNPTEVLIADGTYKGTWEVGVTFRQAIGATMTQTFKAGGDFTLKVDRGTYSMGMAANLSKLEGEMRSSTVMQWTVPAAGAQADQKLEGFGWLKLDGEVSGSRFKAKSEHSTSGQLSVTASLASRTTSQSFSNSMSLDFVADQGNCEGASGRVLSDTLTESINMAKRAGVSVELQAWTWRMAREQEEGGDRIQKFKEELSKKAPTGIVRTREAEAIRLGKLADRIKKDEPESLRECLWLLWTEHITQQYQAWAQEDAQSLKGYQGDWSGLRQRIVRALETLRSLSLLGQDECTAGVQEKVWMAMQGALSYHLDRMARGQAPINHLLKVLKEAQILGTVSPAIEARVENAIQTQAKTQADLTYNYFNSAAQAAKGAKRVPAKDPAVMEAFRTALNAEKAANILGLELRQTLDLADSLGLFG
jgi:hypothetical protein